MTRPPIAPVILCCPPGSALGAGLREALAARGWPVAPPGSGRAYSRAVILLEDDAGSPWAGAPLPTAASIGIGSLRTARALARLADRGGFVINQELPFLALLGLLEAALAATGEAPRRHDPAQAVRARAMEAKALSSLTERERDVLVGLLRGHSASLIAAASSRSLSTIRAQIQSLTGRLGVSSQLSAVAVAHRSGHGAGLGEHLTAIHQF